MIHKTASDPLERPSDSSRKRPSPGGINQTILAMGGGAILLSLVSIFGPTRHVVEHHHAVSKSHIPHKRHPPPLPKNIVRVEELAHEEMFHSTIKSCLPEDKKKKCKEYIIPNVDPPMQRIAVLSPPGVISSTLLNEVEKIARKHNRRKTKVNADIQLIESTHVPPYGYGKTHGLTKIIRMVPRPLVLEATDALQAVLGLDQDASDVTLNDLKSALRQVLRFHCRLSHVAAHTAMLSVPFLDMVSNPESVEERVETFLTSKDTPEEAAESNEGEETDDDSMSLFDSEEAYGARMLSFVQEKSPVDVLHVLDQVLLHEMKITKNMTAWPCPGFWASGEPSSPTKLSTLTRRLAKQLAPDCNDPLVTCFVGRDKCEAAGDGDCKGEK